MVRHRFVPETSAGRAGLDAVLSNPQHALVALDFDGTLAPIVADPASAYAHPDALPILRRLSPALRAIAIITGRPAQQAVDLANLQGNTPDNLTVLGAYGAERWEGRTGSLEVPQPPAGIAEVRAELPNLLARHEAPPGTVIEDKGGALAVHTRNATQPLEALELLATPLQHLAERHGLLTEPGRMVFELRPPGSDKGTALLDIVREVDASAVLFAGDDLGDRAAFSAVDRMRSRGAPGLKVYSDNNDTEDTVQTLSDEADLRVSGGPAGVVDLLRFLSEELGI